MERFIDAKGMTGSTLWEGDCSTYKMEDRGDSNKMVDNGRYNGERCGTPITPKSQPTKFSAPETSGKLLDNKLTNLLKPLIKPMLCQK